MIDLHFCTAYPTIIQSGWGIDCLGRMLPASEKFSRPFCFHPDICEIPTQAGTSEKEKQAAMH